jgi:hypothetical protein
MSSCSSPTRRRQLVANRKSDPPDALDRRRGRRGLAIDRTLNRSFVAVERCSSRARVVSDAGFP